MRLKFAACIRAADRYKKSPKDGTDLSKYFGVLKDDTLLDKLEADSKRIGAGEVENLIPGRL